MCRNTGKGRRVALLAPFPAIDDMSRAAATIDNTNSKNPLGFVQVADVLMGTLIADLTPAEFKLLAFFVHRTVFWGRDQVWASLSDMRDGVKGRSFAKLHAGTGLSTNTLKTAVAGLIARGYVKVTEDAYGRRATQYEIDKEAIMLRKPKRLTQEQGDDNEAVANFANENDAPSVSKIDTLRTPMRIKNCHLHITERSSVGKLKGNSGKLKGESPQGGDCIADARKTVEQIRERKKTRIDCLLSQRQLRKRDVEELWVGVVRSAFPELTPTPLSGKASHAMFQKQRRYGDFVTEVEGGATEKTFPKFLEWCASTWVVMGERHFSWMTNYPAYPDPWFLIRWMDDFALQFMQGKAAAELANESDASLITKLVRVRGMSQHDAERLVNRRKVMGKHEEALRIALKALVSAERALEGATTQAARRTALTSAASARKQAADARAALSVDVEAFVPDEAEFEAFE